MQSTTSTWTLARGLRRHGPAMAVQWRAGLVDPAPVLDHHRSLNGKSTSSSVHRLRNAARVESLRANQSGATGHKIPSLTVRPSGSESDRHHIRQFNASLLASSNAPYRDSCREELWGSYQEAKENVSGFLSILPDGAFRRLWKIQSSYRPNDDGRLRNMKVLIQDMVKAGLDVGWEKKILGLEDKFAAGEQDAVLRDWCRGISSQPTQHSTQKPGTAVSIEQWKESLWKMVALGKFDRDWLELGIRLHAAAGKLEKTCDLLGWLARRFSSSEPRSLIFIIDLSLKLGLDVENAWALFLELLEHPSYSLCLHDYESIFHSFLRAGSVAYSTAVLCRAMHAFGRDVAHQPLLFGDLARKLHDICSDLDETDAVSMHIVKYLPNGMPTNLFYRSWLDHSAKNGDPRRVSLIIESIFEIERNPQPWHLDRLIQVWFEQSGNEYSGKAEDLARAMIKKRVESSSNVSAVSSLVDSSASWLPRFIRRRMPSAGAYTFIQLMNQYAKQGHVKSTHTVLKLLMGSTTLKLNSSMIRAILATHFIMDDVKGAWDFFSKVSQDEMYPIDLGTYHVLWRGLNQHLIQNPPGSKSIRRYPPPRKIFRQMVKYYLKDPGACIPFEERPSGPMYSRIIHCFCLADDSVGALMALHAMKYLFGQEPTQKAMEFLVKNMAYRFFFRDRRRHNWVRNKRSDQHRLLEYRRAVSRMLRAVHADYQARKSSGGPQLGVTDDLAPGAISPSLDVLSTFMKKSLVQFSTPQLVKKAIVIAKEHMGLNLLGSTQSDQTLAHGQRS